MNFRLAFSALAAALLASGASGQEAPVEPAPELKALAENCTARKFETIIEVTVDGTKRGRRFRLCGTEGQSDADWIKTLQDAAAKIAANESMTQEMRHAAVAALNQEIARLDRPAGASASIDLSSEPAPPAGAAAADYSPLPTIPPPPRAPAAALAGQAPSAAPSSPALRLTIRCLERGERGDGSSCDFLEKETLLWIRADSALPRGATLRLLRKGEARGEIALAPMTQGQAVRAKLPSQLCAGVATSRAEIQVLQPGSSTVAATLGPFGLRC